MENVMLEEMINKFKENNPTKQLVLLYEAGSHFFDLNGPQSDTDYRGLYIDDYQDSFESSKKVYQVDYKTKIGGGKNSAEDVDFTIFSLSTFIMLLRNGDFNMMEMLYVPENKVIFKTPIFEELQANRDLYMLNDISAFLGFINKEYKRYGINIFHYKLQDDFSNFLKQWPKHDRLSKHWEEITAYVERTDGLHMTTTKIQNSELIRSIPSISLAGRLHQNTVTIEHATEEIDNILSRYGHRQKSMAVSGKEFKGLYHAMRLIFEANDIFDTGELSFPFSKERHDLLKRIKNGEIEKDDLFALIDTEIEKLYIRETSVESNKYRVQKILLNLELTLRGRLSIKGAFANPRRTKTKKKKNR